ncbi:MAG: hypothetical protein UW88_C0016G0022 [Candidatus Collierbacteria bacterium GW2011_GWD2_45_10]|nr:MAG: hypothetical protein UW31_C0018G0004 [Candidatus Collierbacteria bacterium GW2011_GWA2_44_13]KKT62065.1 MAG: hypothetical protein UW56_C0012G0004 [Candidatus Collierbacteria bacterium GW2011_GWD1_44_27]KKT88057.1 MAG: hypothetical protein UW88_C0016G0022 [Candidatus Collierbacteria bacterium GW2011_GWD2_45_10]
MDTIRKMIIETTQRNQLKPLSNPDRTTVIEALWELKISVPAVLVQVPVMDRSRIQ